VGWKLKGPPKTVRITAKLASEWAKMDSAHTDRPLSERRMREHKRTLAAGMFRPVLWAKAYCLETKQWVRVNGRTTSTLFSVTDLSKVQPLLAVVEVYECDTLADVARLHATFDSRTQMRTAADVNRAYAAVCPDLAGIDGRTINLLAGGLGYAEWPVRSGGGDHVQAERAELMYQNINFCLWVANNFPAGDKNNILRRVPVVAAMAVTYRKDPDDADVFWRAVRDETGVSPDKPDRKLSKFLLTFKVNVGAHVNAAPVRYRVSPREFYAKSILAWNAWRKALPTDLKYHHSAALPVVV